jgi:hypothetical protein
MKRMMTMPGSVSPTTKDRHVQERHLWGGDSEQQLVLPFSDALPSDTATDDDQPPVVKSISQDDPIRRIVIFLAERAALEDHLAWEAEQRRSRGGGWLG